MSQGSNLGDVVPRARRRRSTGSLAAVVLLSSMILAVHAGPAPVGAATISDFELMVDINQAGADSRSDSFVATSSGLYFSADDGVHGSELWLTDGTTTQMVADIDPNGSSVPRDLIEAGGEVYFSASTPELGRELWKTDGTALGTVLVKDISRRVHGLRR